MMALRTHIAESTTKTDKSQLKSLKLPLSAEKKVTLPLALNARNTNKALANTLINFAGVHLSMKYQPSLHAADSFSASGFSSRNPNIVGTRE